MISFVLVSYTYREISLRMRMIVYIKTFVNFPWCKPFHVREKDVLFKDSYRMILPTAHLRW